LKARAMRVEFADGQTHLGIPLKFADEPGAIRPVAPALGEHSRSALAQVGYGEAELDALARSGAIR
jgi:crotonobetainyl-CoA:carnitine CoA-transferase CaiB-like acyl-CoA transferase